MIAKVIVDLPVSQVNHPFDYLIPEEMIGALKLGARVRVPFGSRQLLGFVVDMVEEADYEGQLKPISQILDYQPFLTQELLDLSAYLTDYLQSFRISILQTMLPAMLKVKYETFFQIQDQAAVESMGLTLDPETRRIDKADMEANLSAGKIQKLIDQGAIDLVYQVLDRKKDKTQPFYKTVLAAETLKAAEDQLDSRARKQKLLLAFLQKQVGKDWQPLTQLTKDQGFSSTIIKTARENGWLQVADRIVYADPLKEKVIAPNQKRVFTSQQEKAYQKIESAIQENLAKTFLIEGVTGSGKTEVYLQLMAAALDRGQSAILLVPEIALTPQMVDRVVGRFGRGVAVLHSGLSHREKFDEWQRIKSGQAKLVVGARSSIFAPLDNIGLIIIDEEHETTYKQADNPRYHARDVAKWRSNYHKCPLVLGSATPSLESRARAQVGNYDLILMTQRANQTDLPPVQLIDMTKVLAQETDSEISPVLLEAIKDRIKKDQQVVLLLNRRGYASYIQCRSCGQVVMCPRCDISLTYHQADHRLKCHYCDYQQAQVAACPHCASPHLKQAGSGTQKIQSQLEVLLPEAKIIRMDNDTTRRKGDHERLLAAFAKGQAQILLGTQMIAKGLDFEKVTLVGVINADTALNIPDFRSAEKTFQLLTQVAGRAGRGRYPGQVLVQTYNPDHYVMQLAKYHDYEQFFRYEMKRRHLGQYPPYFYTTLITASSKQAAKAELAVNQIKGFLTQKVASKESLIILGPSKSPIARVNERYYFQLLIKYKDPSILHDAMTEIVDQAQQSTSQGLYVSVDHEPLHFI
ncbi:TPA: primosomal protein N' [Streptococcus suis]